MAKIENSIWKFYLSATLHYWILLICLAMVQNWGKDTKTVVDMSREGEFWKLFCLWGWGTNDSLERKVYLGGFRIIVGIGVLTTALKNTTTLFLAKTPLECPSPAFLGIPPYILVFRDTPAPPLKVRFFSEPQKY